MKFQLVILCSLLAIAYTWPVPDEEVSAVKPIASNPEVQPEVVKDGESKPVEVVKPESRSAPESEPEKPIELEKKIDLPLSAPDSELPSIIPEKKEAKPEAKSDIKLEEPIAAAEKKLEEDKPEEKKPEAKVEKQTRAEVVDAVPDNEQIVKALPVVEAPVAHVGEEKQVVQEGKSVVHEIEPAVVAAVPEGKSAELPAELPAEPKKEDLATAESAPVLKTETPLEPAAALAPAPAPAAAEELPARQERVNVVEEKVADNQVDHVQVIKSVEPEVAKVEPEVVVPAVKSLSPSAESAPAPILAEAAPAEAQNEIKAGEEPKIESQPELKTSLESEEKPAAIGDIPAQQSGNAEEPSKAKDLKVSASEHHEHSVAVPEVKKLEEPAPAPEAPAAPAAESADKEETKPIEQPEEKPASSLKDSSEESSEESKEVKKDSANSEESAEKTD